MSISSNDLWRRGNSIVHSYAGPPAGLRTALRLIADRRIDVASMVAHGFRLSVSPGFETYQAQPIVAPMCSPPASDSATTRLRD